MEERNGIRAFHARNGKAWRNWLAKHHKTENSVLLIIYHKDAATRSVYYNEAVEEALCFGWIDSTAYKRDEESKYQFFTRRKPKSTWSKVNRERVERLLAEGRMMPAGLEMVELAKASGTWTAMDDVEDIKVPADLLKRFKSNKKAMANFQSFSRSSKKIILTWIHSAKRSETRERRIEETVRLAEKNEKANHYIKKTS